MIMVDDLLARARSAIGREVRYRLGAGGMDPRGEDPENVNNECECSGFACWALGISRQTDHPLYVRFNGGGINTNAMVHDAGSPTGFFTRLVEPRAGSIVVYGARPPRRKVGHVGIVMAIKPEVRVLQSQLLRCRSRLFRPRECPRHWTVRTQVLDSVNSRGWTRLVRAREGMTREDLRLSERSQPR